MGCRCVRMHHRAMLLGGGEHNEGDGIRVWLYTMGVVEYGRGDGRWEMMAAVVARCDARRRVPVRTWGWAVGSDGGGGGEM